VIYALIGILAFAACICIVAAMAADDVDHYTEPEPGPGIDRATSSTSRKTAPRTAARPGPAGPESR